MVSLKGWGECSGIIEGGGGSAVVSLKGGGRLQKYVKKGI